MPTLHSTRPALPENPTDPANSNDLFEKNEKIVAIFETFERDKIDVWTPAKIIEELKMYRSGPTRLFLGQQARIPRAEFRVGYDGGSARFDGLRLPRVGPWHSGQDGSLHARP